MKIGNRKLTIMSEEKITKIPEKFQNIVEKIEQMSVLDLAELVKVLEEKFGVTASPMMMAAPGGAPSSEEGVVDAEAKDAFTIVLKASGDQKIQVIKVVREVLGLGLKEAKDLVDAVPKTVKEGLKKAEADDLKKKFEEAGATVELK